MLENEEDPVASDPRPNSPRERSQEVRGPDHVEGAGEQPADREPSEIDEAGEACDLENTVEEGDPCSVGRTFSLYVEAARPRTLVLSLLSVATGAVAAKAAPVDRLAAALLCALSLQIAVNFANDYFDGVRGVDAARRHGPRRLVASGLLPARSVLAAGLGALAMAAVAGTYLVVVARSGVLLVLGASCLAAVVLYSGGPKPYADLGLGELAVFVFFGPVAVWGTAYVLSGSLGAEVVVLGAAHGMLAAAVLAANNLRDLDTDRQSGKKTLVVRLGERHAPWVWRLPAVFAVIVPIGVAATGVVRPWVAVPGLAAVASVVFAWRLSDRPGAAAAPLLPATVRLATVFGVAAVFAGITWRWLSGSHNL